MEAQEKKEFERKERERKLMERIEQRNEERYQH